MLGQPNPPSLQAPPTPQAVCAQNPAGLPCQPGAALFCRISPNDASCYVPAAAGYSAGHWGLIAAALISALIVYQIATR